MSSKPLIARLGILIAITVLQLPACTAGGYRPNGMRDGPPGSVVAHRFASQKVFLGSPSITRLEDGTLLISHDEFGPAASGNRAFIYKSSDGGAHWYEAATIVGQYWSSLFVFRKGLYLIGTTGDRGVPVIRRSMDDGATWSIPNSEKNGLFPLSGRYLSAPVPVLFEGGRIWRSMERVLPSGLESIVLSVPDDTNDLLDTSRWTVSAGALPDTKWLAGKFGGWLEGNLVPKPGGGVANVLRVNYNNRDEKAAIVNVDSTGSTTTFSPDTNFINFPGGGKKFTIRRDESTGYYLALSNSVGPDYRGNNFERARNRLSLIYSRDLETWDLGAPVLDHPDWNHHGYQYADWIFEGDDIITAIRVSANDSQGTANNQHDSNYIIFLRITNYRSLLNQSNHR